MAKEAEILRDLARFVQFHGGVIAGNQMGSFYSEYPQHREHITSGNRNVRLFCESHPNVLSFSMSAGPPGTISLVAQAQDKTKANAKVKAKAKAQNRQQNGTGDNQTPTYSDKYHLSNEYTMCCKWFHGECKYKSACAFLHEDLGWNPCKYGSSCSRDHRVRATSLRDLWVAVLKLLEKNSGRIHVGSGLEKLYKENDGYDFKSLLQQLGGAKGLCTVFRSAISYELHTTEGGASQPMICATCTPVAKVAPSVEAKPLNSSNVQSATRQGPSFKLKADISQGCAVASFEDEHIRDEILKRNGCKISIKSLQIELKPYIDKMGSCEEVPTKIFVGWKVSHGKECDFSIYDLISFFDSECAALGAVAAGSDNSLLDSSSKLAHTASQSQSRCDERLAKILSEVSANESWSSKVLDALNAMQSRQSKLEEAERHLRMVMQEEWSRLHAHEHMLRNWQEEIKAKEAEAANRFHRWEERLRNREAALSRQESIAIVPRGQPPTPPIEKQEDCAANDRVLRAPPPGEDGWDRYHDEASGKHWWFHENSGRWFFEGDIEISAS